MKLALLLIIALSITARGDLAVSVVKASSLYPELNPYLDQVAFEASKTALWNYTLTIEDLKSYFELAKEALAANDLERASRYVGIGLGALCDLIPHSKEDEELASTIIERVDTSYIEDPFVYLEELASKLRGELLTHWLHGSREWRFN